MENNLDKLLGKENLQNLGKNVSNFFSSLTEKKKHAGSATIIMTRQQSVTAIAVGIISCIAMLVYGYLTYQKHISINNKAQELIRLKQYNISLNQEVLGSHISNESTINDLLVKEEEVAADLEKNKGIADIQGKYYNLFLRYLYLPSINIWKTPYTDQIDPTIMGQKYLDEDPFQDIYLIQQWSDFFKDIGEGAEYNEVTTISIGDIEDIDTQHFIIPITLSFTAPDKRSFLLLVNKLSMTSNTNNISLLNEFFFYLISHIKEKKKAEIKQLQVQYAPLFAGSETLNEDIVIGYHLYQRIKHNEENILIDDALIDYTIRENVLCDESRQNRECFYAFREKYRDIPYLAYTIGRTEVSNKTSLLKNFLRNLPPIIAIKDFSFEKIQASTDYSFTTTAQGYQGSITLNAYGRSMSEEEVAEIATTLGTLCFGKQEDSPQISLEMALERVNASMFQLGSNLQFSNVINDLEELNQIFTEMQTDYSTLTNYQKSIKLFEIFRMLRDANLCRI
jgi:hypothetical protein